MNEIFLFLSLIVYFSLLLGFYKLFGKTGLYVWTAIAAILANIEVLILANAFGLEMTLGNVMFASTFLVTDIMSERYDKKSANKAVNIGIATIITFTVVTQIWLLFSPSEYDEMMPHIKAIFSLTPRLALASVVDYVLVQKIDIILYHKWWKLTEKLSGNKKSLLWIRNNGSTLISQLINSIVFTLLAFYNSGAFENSQLPSIIISTYLIFIAVSILDTPFMYLARKIKVNELN